MTLQTVNIGTTANDGNGDDPRTGISKINNNFTDTANAASRLVQTSPTDTTADALMAVGAFGGGGAVNISGGTDVQTLKLQGLYEYTAGSPITNVPAEIAGKAAYIIVDAGLGSTKPRQTITEIGVDSGTWESKFNGTTWSAWKRTDPQAFGVGAPLNQDWDNLPSGGVYNQGGTNSPSGFVSGLSSKINADQGFQIMGDTAGGIFVRSSNLVDSAAWQSVYTGANYQPEDSQGLGVVRLMKNIFGTSLNQGAIAGSNVSFVYFNSSGVITDTGITGSGTWRNVSGKTITAGEIMPCVRYI